MAAAHKRWSEDEAGLVEMKNCEQSLIGLGSGEAYFGVYFRCTCPLPSRYVVAIRSCHSRCTVVCPSVRPSRQAPRDAAVLVRRVVYM